MDDERESGPKIDFEKTNPDNVYPFPGDKKDRRFKLIAPGDLIISPDPECLIEGLLGANDLAVIRAGPNGGKTAIALYLGICIATGRPFAGKRVLSGPVVHCVGEGNRGFRKRVAGQFKRMGIKQDNSTPFYVLDEVPDLCGQNAAWAKPNANASHLMQDIQEQVGDPRLVVIDTLSKAMPMADDSKGDEMKKLLGSCHFIAKNLQCAVLLLHHPGWSDKTRGRGHSSLLGDIDTEIEIKGERRETRTTTVTKSRDLDCIGAVMRFNITAEPITAKGEQLTAAAVGIVEDWHFSTGAAPVEERNSRRPRGIYPPMVLDCIIEALIEHGEAPPVALRLPAATRVVHKTRVMDEARKRSIIDGDPSSHNFRSRMAEAFRSLVGSKHIQMRDVWLWMVLK